MGTTFWIGLSIFMLVAVIVSVFGPVLGIYGDYEKSSDDKDDQK